ncbi:MAG TPA: RHS repeat-associated core domain-containing protein [Thermoanaerobaculia bacterium]|nr:RHS repeat-associated core domain-containing protein [Thermoanaerobaculia bacterium]
MRTILYRLLTVAVSALSCATLSAQSDIEIGSYTYDASGNITAIGRDSQGLLSTFEYDSAGRISRLTQTNAHGVLVRSETYEYDGYGNQTGRTLNGVWTSLPASPETNRLSGGSYDADGNLNQYGDESYSFDPIGTMTTRTGSAGSAFYLYTADDERVGVGVQGTNGPWRYMVRDLDDKVLREWSSTTWNGDLHWIEDYVYRGGLLAAAERPVAQGGIRHFHVDHLGSVRVISGHDKSIYAQHSYLPFGTEITNPAQEVVLGHDTPEPMKFTGHERDLTGADFNGPALDYMHARYYSPALGRFLSVDPQFDLEEMLHNPQMWNRYTYVQNNPVRFVDPDGRAAREMTKEELTELAKAVVKNAPKNTNPIKLANMLIQRAGDFSASGAAIAGALKAAGVTLPKEGAEMLSNVKTITVESKNNVRNVTITTTGFTVPLPKLLPDLRIARTITAQVKSSDSRLDVTNIAGLTMKLGRITGVTAQALSNHKGGQAIRAQVHGKSLVVPWKLSPEPYPVP